MDTIFLFRNVILGKNTVLNFTARGVILCMFRLICYIKFDFCFLQVAERELQIPRRKFFEEEDKPPYGKLPAEIPKAPFIDPEDFSDKIINSNPFPSHMANLKSEYEAAQSWFEQRQSQNNAILTEEQQQIPMLATA